MENKIDSKKSKELFVRFEETELKKLKLLLAEEAISEETYIYISRLLQRLGERFRCEAKRKK